MSTSETPVPAPVAQQFDVFLSYNSRDKAIIERIAQRLKRVGVEPWLDRWSLTPGGDWQRELGAGLDASLACAVFIGPQDLGAWELQEVAVAIDRAVTQEGFRVFPVLLPGVEEPFDPNRLPHFLRARTWVDFRRGRDDGRALQDLINAVKGVPFGPDVPVARGDDVVPYRGLRVFSEQDAQFFFGRDREVQRLLEKLKSSRFVAVLGPSGSGKSSLVRAGLVPALRAGALGQVENWHVLLIRPGAAPLTALAAQLAALRDGEAMQATLDQLAHDPRSLHLSVELALAGSSPADRVLLVVDQLEEVFTLCRDDTMRQQLFSTLLYALSAPQGRTVVIVTMRADFYVRCASYPELAQLITAEQMLVGPMETDALYQAIEEPARRVGLELEDGLSQTILADVAAEPGALPLLEHALLELWERRRGHMLTLEGYRLAGGVHGALAQRADSIFGELSTAQQDMARRTLLRLTQPGEGSEDTRRRATRSELSPVNAERSFDEVLGRLVDARLLTTGRDETGQEVVDVSHEALIRGWPRLRAWIDADREGLLVHRRLTAMAHEWATLKHEPAALYRGGRLAAALEWATGHPDDLSQLERAFLIASQAAEESERRRLRRRTRLALGGVATAIMISVVALLAILESQEASRQRDITASRAMASSATIELDIDPALSLALALRALARRDTEQAQNALRQATLAARALNVWPTVDGTARALSVSRDGLTVATGGDDGVISVRRIDTGRLISAIKTSFAPVTSVALRPDGQRVVAARDDGTVTISAIDGGRRRVLLDLGRRSVRGYNSRNYGVSVSFSNNGRRLAVGALDGTVRVLPADHGGRVLVARGNTAQVLDVAFNGDGSKVISAASDGAVRVWNLRSGGMALWLSHEGATSASFSPDDRQIATAGLDGVIGLWSSEGRGRPRNLRIGQPLRSVRFSRDGRRVVTSGADGIVRILDVRTGLLLDAPKLHHGVVSRAAFVAGGELVSTGEDGTLQRWAPLGGTILRGHFVSATFSSHGRQILTGGRDGRVRVYDVLTGADVATIGPDTKPTTARYSMDGTQVITVSLDGAVRIADPRTGSSRIVVARDPARAKRTADLDPSAKRIVSAGDDARVVVESVNGGGKRLVLSGHRDAVTDVRFSPDGRHVLTASEDGTARIWNATTGQVERVLSAHVDTVNTAEYSADGKRIVTASADGTIGVWPAGDAGRPVILRGPEGGVNAVAFSPDGKRIVSAGVDGTVRVWDPASENALVVLYKHHAAALSVSFSPTGKSVVSIGKDGVAKVSPCEVCGSLAQVLRLARTRAVRAPNAIERQLFLLDVG